MRTKYAIRQEIKALKAVKPKVIRYNALGGDNHKAIDAQIEVLENNLKQDDVYDRIWEETVETAALGAVEWLEDDLCHDLSLDWKNLIVE